MKKTQQIVAVHIGRFGCRSEPKPNRPEPKSFHDWTPKVALAEKPRRAVARVVQTSGASLMRINSKRPGAAATDVAPAKRRMLPRSCNYVALREWAWSRA